MPKLERVRELFAFCAESVKRGVTAKDPPVEGEMWIVDSRYRFSAANLVEKAAEIKELLDDLVGSFRGEEGEEFQFAPYSRNSQRWTRESKDAEDLLAMGCAIGRMEIQNERAGQSTRFREAPNADFQLMALQDAVKRAAEGGGAVQTVIAPPKSTAEQLLDRIRKIRASADQATADQETKQQAATEGDTEMATKKPDAKTQLELDIKKMSVERTGNKLIVPEHLSYESAIKALEAKLAEDASETEIIEKFEMTVPEGAIALYRALNDLYGFVESMRVPGFFGSKPPQLLKVQTSPTESVTIPWGRFGVPGVVGYIETTINWKDSVPYFGFKATVAGRHKLEIERLAQAVRLQHLAIYKGKSIRVSFPSMEEATSMEDFFPTFMTLSGVGKDDLIFTDDVAELVDVSLFTPIEKTQFCRDHGIPLKRGILLEGPYGVGKTLTVNVAAKLCEREGWTFIQVKRAKDLARAIAFALLHQPALVFCEDLDEVLQNEEDRDEQINAILNQADGVDSKGAEVITVFTTNDLEAITKAMLRPGRIDTVVPVRPPDARAAERLIRLYAGASLPAIEDLTAAGELLSGHNAAVVREVVTRSKLSAVRRCNTATQDLTLEAHDIEIAAKQMQAHSALLVEEAEDDRSDIEKGFSILGDALSEVFGPDPSISNHQLPPLPQTRKLPAAAQG
jgi:transitional endoplasmic reticulum ATPase